MLNDHHTDTINPTFGQLLQVQLQVWSQRRGKLPSRSQECRQNMINARGNGGLDDLAV